VSDKETLPDHAKSMRMMGPHSDMPSSVVHKLCKAVTGTKDFTVASYEQRQAIFMAMEATREPEQSYVRWRNRAFGLLARDGWASR